MKITQVSYKRIFNLGNYETATIELTAEINDFGDTPETCMDELVRKVMEWKSKKQRGEI